MLGQGYDFFLVIYNSNYIITLKRIPGFYFDHRDEKRTLVLVDIKIHNSLFTISND